VLMAGARSVVEEAADGIISVVDDCQVVIVTVTNDVSVGVAAVSADCGTDVVKWVLELKDWAVMVGVRGVIALVAEGILSVVDDGPVAMVVALDGVSVGVAVGGCSVVVAADGVSGVGRYALVLGDWVVVEGKCTMAEAGIKSEIRALPSATHAQYERPIKLWEFLCIM